MPDKVALLTGGAGGIGAATARMLSTRGWQVIAPTRSELDMDSLANIADWGAAIEKMDALVFCHGEWYSRPLTEQYASHFYNQYGSRVCSPTDLIHWTLHALKGGCVIMVASTRGFMGGVNTGPYAAACAAQIALMQGYAREYQGVRFNVVCPGLTATDMEKRVRATGGCKPDAVAQPPKEVARIIVKIATDGESNGRVVRVVNGVAEDMAWGVVNTDLGNKRMGG